MLDPKAHSPGGARPPATRPGEHAHPVPPHLPPHPPPPEPVVRPPPREPGWFATHHQALAPWAQAIGSALAILAAFVIGGIEQHSARVATDEERALQGEILSYAVRYELLSLKKSFDPVVEAQQAQTTSPEKVLALSLYIPPELAAARDRLYLLGRDEGLAVQKALSDAQRVAFLLDFVRKDANAYADFYAKRGIADNSGAGTAVYFNAKALDAAVYALNTSLTAAIKVMKVPERDLM
jgi:hypothetical protein